MEVDARIIMILLDPDLVVPKKTRSAPAGLPTAPAVERAPWRERIPAQRTLASFLAEAQKAVKLKGEVSVLLTTDKAIRRLNRDFRGKNKATDVLSFPAEAGFVYEAIAGDLAISVDTALKQAREQDHALTCELKILMLHGLLHLAGFDHEADEGQMARRERTLRTRLRLPVGLIERAGEAQPKSKKTVKTATKKAVKKAAKKAVARKTSTAKKSAPSTRAER